MRTITTKAPTDGGVTGVFRHPRFICALLFTSAATSPILAEVVPAPVFRDGIVLQRDKPIAIWGRATTEDEVSVAFQGHTVTALVEDQQWKAILPSLPTSSEGRELVVTGENTVKFKDVLVGEVWVAAGQSNMFFSLNYYKELSKSDAAKELARSDIANANMPTVRVCPTYTDPYTPVEPKFGAWTPALPDRAQGISAPVFYFCRSLQESLEKTENRVVPIGVVVSAVGGRPIEYWMPRDTICQHPATAPIVEKFKKAASLYSKEQYEKRHEEWVAVQMDFQKRRRAGEKGLDYRNLPEPPEGRMSPKRPGVYYETSISALVPMTIRGFLWYQGESNYLSPNRESAPWAYRFLQRNMIKRWRADWQDESLPFLFVQIAPFDAHKTPHVDWDRYPGYQPIAELWDSQLNTVKTVPHTGMAIQVDADSNDNIHPSNKREVGERLALLARQMVYGEDDLASSGPLYRDFRIDGNGIILDFDHVGSGLEMREPNDGYLICGADKKFVSAKAVIQGNSVRVWSDQVSNPVAVRYGWDGKFSPGLINREGLPASPFRTDEFILASQQEKFGDQERRQ